MDNYIKEIENSVITDLNLNEYDKLQTRAGGTTMAAPAMAGAISGRPIAMHCWQVA